MRALAITGPRASPQQLEPFRAAEPGLSVLESPAVEQVREAIKTLRPDLVLIFGGDGTINRHLGQLARTNIPVLPVPTGSGNDLARAAGIDSVTEALQVWQRAWIHLAPIQAVDLGLIKAPTLEASRYFSCCVNIGLDAKAARYTNALPDWLKSHRGYFLGGLFALIVHRPDIIKLISDERRQSEKVWFISVSNTPTFGGGLNIAPQASIKDGVLDVTYAATADFSRLAVAHHFPKILSGLHTRVRGMQIFTTSHLEIQTPRHQAVYADGEYITETPCEIEVAQGALRLVTARVL
jgi:diacylglycerol kinase (ATP)